MITVYKNPEYNSENQKEYVEKGFFDKAKETLAKVPFVVDAVALYHCAMDPETPLLSRATAFSALAYFILPLDMVPDLIPVGGYGDDAGVITAALLALAPYITAEHREKARTWLEGEG